MTKPFARFARKAGITESALWRAACDVAAGKIDADLGSGVVKQRIARPGQGKSGGSRSIVLFRVRGRAVFAYGFEKKGRANIEARELAAFRELADIVLGYSESEIAKRVADGALLEILPQEQ